MGTTIEVWSERTELLEVSVDWFAEFERVCSRFIRDSELSRMNDARERRFVVSPLMASAIGAAERAREITAGLVDAGLGGVLAAWGYDTSFAAVTGLDSPPRVDGVGRSWHLDGEILERDAGVQIDLGGIGKGWACDIAVESGWAKVASAGGDIRSADPETRVPVVDPWGTTVADVALGVGALATSSVTRRRWRVGSGEAHHLIDPRTGAPAQTPVLSATVVAESTLEAEAGAKAVLILGADGLRWAERQDWIESALVVWHGGSVFATNGLELVA
jgi:thiamine biosynthesis lipoprotein